MMVVWGWRGGGRSEGAWLWRELMPEEDSAAAVTGHWSGGKSSDSYCPRRDSCVGHSIYLSL